MGLEDGAGGSGVVAEGRRSGDGSRGELRLAIAAIASEEAQQHAECARRASLTVSQESIDKRLPSSHACFFSLHLPRYSSDAVLRERLLYAIHNCVALDADYRATDEMNRVWE